MTTKAYTSSYLEILQNTFYKECGLNLIDLKLALEANKYSACSFSLNSTRILYRESNITPKKLGQFVAIWKRDESGVTQPYDIQDAFDFMIILAKEEKHIGQFVFPKAVLASKGIISQNNKSGKRGIRVYPPWCKPTSKQAEKTQAWQLEYFIELEQKIEFKKLLGEL